MSEQINSKESLEKKNIPENLEEVSAKENIEEKEEKKTPEEELNEYKNKYLRLLADQENSRKRLQKEKQETVRFAIENTVSEFLPMFDNFENALNFSQSSSKEVQQWACGFQMILSQFRDILHNYGIVAFHSEGNLFNPHFHEAMELVETEEHPDGTIIEEFAKGYKSGKRTIRPAKVKVAKSPQKGSEEKSITNSEEETPEEDKIL
jgi:molecular chaperone GrpE